MQEHVAERKRSQSRAHHLLWVYTEDVKTTLDSATWLETTRELRALGWQVTLTSATAPGTQEVRGVEVLGIPKPNVYLLRQVLFHFQIVRLLWREWQNLDVVLFHQMSAPWILPFRLVRLLRREQRPLFIMDTRTVPMTVATTKDRIRAAFDNLMNRAANLWADGQTAITERMAELVHIPARHRLGTWPSGVNLQTFTAAHQRRWPSAGESVRFIYVGTLRQERNLLLMCQMLERANQAGMNFCLSIIGDGPERAELERFAATTAGRIQVLPPVPHEQVPALLAQAHVGILPFPDTMIFRVSSPIKLFEYMAAGLPIFATRIDCHTDVLGDASYVFWAGGGAAEEIYTALAACWASRTNLADMGAAAFVAAERWTWAASARKLAAALTQALPATKQAATPSLQDRVIT